MLSRSIAGTPFEPTWAIFSAGVSLDTSSATLASIGVVGSQKVGRRAWLHRGGGGGGVSLQPSCPGAPGKQHLTRSRILPLGWPQPDLSSHKLVSGFQFSASTATWQPWVALHRLQQCSLVMFWTEPGIFCMSCPLQSKFGWKLQGPTKGGGGAGPCSANAAIGRSANARPRIAWRRMAQPESNRTLHCSWLAARQPARQAARQASQAASHAAALPASQTASSQPAMRQRCQPASQPASQPRRDIAPVLARAQFSISPLGGPRLLGRLCVPGTPQP